MAKTALLNLMVEIPDDEKYPEAFVMNRLSEILAYKDVQHFWNEFQVDMDFVIPKQASVNGKAAPVAAKE